MKNIIIVQENKLMLNSSDEIIFDEEIYQVIEIEEVVVVLTMPQKTRVTANRIYGVIDGKVAWRVQDILDFNPDYEPFLPEPYSGINVYEKNPEIIIATTVGGFRFLINPHNGKIVGTESWVK